MNENILTVTGNVVSDPETKKTRDGRQPFTVFRIASTGRRVDFRTGEYIDTGTNFYDVTAWRALGLNVAQSIRKGQPVIVHGKLRITQWKTELKSGTRVEIDAYSIGHDLKLGRSAFERVSRATLELAPAPDRADEPEAERPAGAGFAAPADPGFVPLDEELEAGSAAELEGRSETDFEARADTDEYVLAPAVGG